MTPAEYLARWEREQIEWKAIAEELVALHGERCVTAFQVSLAQRKRALARGETLLTPEDLEEVNRQVAEARRR